MKIYIEIVIILLLMLSFIVWRMWLDFSKKKLLKKIQEHPELDVSRKYDDRRNEKGGIFGSENPEVRTTESTVEPTTFYSGGLEQLERRELFPKESISDDGKDSISTRDDSSTSKRRFFFRRRK